MRRLVLLTALMTACSRQPTEPPTASKPAKPGLEAFAGKERLSGDDIQALARRYREITGEELKTHDRLEPWWVAKPSDGRTLWILLLVYPGYDIPDVSFVEIHIFDASWKRLAIQSFPTGYRMFLREARLVQSEELKQDLLAIKTECAGPFIVVDGKPGRPAFEQGNYQMEYYAFAGNRVELVRIEDDTRRVVRNSYRWSRPMKGPPPPALGAKEWFARLRSKDPVEVLATLAWITGAHMASTAPRPADVDRESAEDSLRFEAAAGSAELRTLIETLKSHDCPWIREVAQLGILPGEK